jgi:hypothetical protein
MKASTVGLVLGAILMVVAGVGFGIAQAGGNHTDGPVLSFEDQEALEQGDSSSTYVRVLPSGIDLSYDADGNPSSGVAEVAQAKEAVQAGSLPTEGNEIELYLFEGKLYGVP